jgi:[ribosomal protein S18]-alanine N-acetyltransferase
VSGVTRPATRAELAWVAPSAVHARVAGSVEELAATLESEPWRVRVTARGEAAILGRWREHTDDCAVMGLWCSARRVPLLIADLLEVARHEGFERLVGPLVSENEAAPYLDAGLRVIERVIVMRMKPMRLAAPAHAIEGLQVRAVTADDMDGLLRLDAECFDPFWHYDATSLARLASSDRVVVGVLDGRTVGYTLCTLRAGDGSLGRLAVSPAFRRRGIGGTLVADAVEWLAAQGARQAVLSTQEDNTASRTLYRASGFRETGDVLVACASGALEVPGAGHEAVTPCPAG